MQTATLTTQRTQGSDLISVTETWDAHAERKLLAMKPKEVETWMKSTWLRSQMHLPGHENHGKFLDPAYLLQSGERGRLVDGLKDLRHQIDVLGTNLGEEAARKVKQVYQIQLCPESLRREMSRFLAIRVGAEETDKQFIPLHEVRVYSLHHDRGQLGQKADADLFRIKCHGVQVLPGAGLMIGGLYKDVTGLPVSMTYRSRVVNLYPRYTTDTRVCDTNDLLDIGLGLHEELELGAASGNAGAMMPLFPKVWAGFDPEDLDFNVAEGSSATKLLGALAALDLQGGYEPTADNTTWLATIADKLKAASGIRLWSDVARCLTEQEQSALLQWAVTEQSGQYCETDGLKYWPLSMLSNVDLGNATLSISSADLLSDGEGATQIVRRPRTDVFKHLGYVWDLDREEMI
jgi:hypothetical protein